MSALKGAFGARLERLERGGVVHSFTGTVEEMTELMDLGLYIGLNGCSFKSAENCDVVRAVRLDRLMIETDGPWCEVRPSHEGWKYLVEMERREREAAQPEPEAQPEPVGGDNAAVTENGSAETPATRRPRPKKQQQQSSKKPQKKESEVLERFKTAKKEKWVEGAMVKGRNEPCMIERVAKIVACIKGVEVEEVCEAAWRNTVKVFGLDET